jgi:hypothetical protein
LAHSFPLITSLTLDVRDFPASHWAILHDAFPLTERLVLKHVPFPSFYAFADLVASFQALQSLGCSGCSIKIREIAGAQPPPSSVIKLALENVEVLKKDILRWLRKADLSLQSVEVTDIHADDLPLISAILGPSVRNVALSGTGSTSATA